MTVDLCMAYYAHAHFDNLDLDARSQGIVRGGKNQHWNIWTTKQAINNTARLNSVSHDTDLKTFIRLGQLVLTSCSFHHDRTCRALCAGKRKRKRTLKRHTLLKPGKWAISVGLVALSPFWCQTYKGARDLFKSPRCVVFNRAVNPVCVIAYLWAFVKPYFSVTSTVNIWNRHRPKTKATFDRRYLS